MFSVFVPGKPQTKGSAKAFMRPGAKFPTVRNDNEKAAGWESLIRNQIRLSIPDSLLRLGEPCEVQVDLYFHRPTDHYRSGRFAKELKPGSPVLMSSGKDVDKALRSVLDALTGVAYADDRQVTCATVRKHWADRHSEAEGASIRVTYLDTQAAEAP